MMSAQAPDRSIPHQRADCITSGGSASVAAGDTGAAGRDAALALPTLCLEIRFGSRLDVFLPDGAKPLVAEGQTSIAGETVLADFRQGDGGRSYRSD